MNLDKVENFYVRNSNINKLDYFPFPFHSNSYRYSNNSKELDPPNIFTITPEYKKEVMKKREILQEAKNMAYQSFSHSLDAQWDIFEMITDQMVSLYPNYFQIVKEGRNWTFSNYLLNERYDFIFGEANSLPHEPLDFIGRHLQEDIFYLGQRDGDLYLDAGQLCFPANWSIAFNIGMTYTEFHSPVPYFSDSGLAKKVRNFLMRMEAGKPWTRLNWTITPGNILDTYPEKFDDWGEEMKKIQKENAGKRVHLRVEDQRLFRLPGSNGILFTIHTYLLSLEELCQKEEWSHRLYHVLHDLPDFMAEYKSFLSYKPAIIEYLESKLVIKEGEAI